MNIKKISFTSIISLVVALAIATFAMAAVDVWLTFEGLTAGTSVEGMGAVHPYLNISTEGDAKIIVEGNPGGVFGVYTDGINRVTNGCIDPDENVVGTGFGAVDENDWRFDFDPEIIVSYFSLRMLDYGDFFPIGTQPTMNHEVRLVAFDTNGVVVDTDVLSFTSTGIKPTNRNTVLYGSLRIAGNACTVPGHPGNYTFEVSGADIAYVELQFIDNHPTVDGNQSTDLGIGFDDIKFTYEFTNQPPVANDDDYFTLQDTAVDIDVLANDVDPDGDPLTASIDEAPQHGVLDMIGNGSYTFTPSAGYCGTDSFTYSISDGKGGTDSATVYIKINCPPIADPNGPYLGETKTPIAFDGSESYDPDGDALTYAWDFGDICDDDDHDGNKERGVAHSHDDDDDDCDDDAHDGTTGTGVTPSHSYASAGIYDVCLTVNDGYQDSVEVCTIVVIYDPSAGFVTGGGWFISPAGAYTDDPSLTGKATFGFVAKYKRRASFPDGNTEFQFKAGDLNFHSNSYEWLVVAGNKAQFKGEGTINGQGSYKFMIWADDDNPDTFRIQIWGDHGTVYDNGSQQELGGGSIVIHKN